MKKQLLENKQGGFLQIIIAIIILLILMKYFDITVPDIIDWIAGLFAWVAAFLRSLF